MSGYRETLPGDMGPGEAGGSGAPEGGRYPERGWSPGPATGPGSAGSAGAQGPPVLVFSTGDPGGVGPEVLLKACRRVLERGAVGEETLAGVKPPMVVCADAGFLRETAGALSVGLAIEELPAGGLEEPGELPADRLYAAGWDARPGGGSGGGTQPAGDRDAISGTAEEEGEAEPRSEDREPAFIELREQAPAELLLPGVHRACRGHSGLAWRSLKSAVDLVLADPGTRALITPPISKSAMREAGFRWPGHTEYLAWRAGRAEALMLMHAGPLSVGLVCNHVPLRDVPRWITAERVKHKALLMLRFIERQAPGEELVLLGLNPHAGDDGLQGTEETEILAPLVRRLRGAGEPIRGPASADGALRRGRGRFLAMYHDQGLGAFKLAAGRAGVNVTLGLGLVRVSPDHGTAFDIAGGGTADPGSMLSAIAAALRQHLQGNFVT